MKYSIDDLKTKIINKDYETGVFTSTNEDGNDVLVVIGDDFFVISTNQSNGWVRVDTYDYDREAGTWTQTESYDGKWN